MLILFICITSLSFYIKIAISKWFAHYFSSYLRKIVLFLQSCWQPTIVFNMSTYCREIQYFLRQRLENLIPFKSNSIIIYLGIKLHRKIVTYMGEIYINLSLLSKIKSTYLHLLFLQFWWTHLIYPCYHIISYEILSPPFHF